MAFYDSAGFRPEVRQRLDPYRRQMEDAAARHGVPADLMFGTVSAESSGIASAAGDRGVAQGLWQVQTPFVRDWLGVGPDVRNDPVRSTERIMPAFRQHLDASGGDWALATVGYVGGKGSKLFKRIQAGEDPRAVLANHGYLLARYNSMKALQSKRGMAPAQEAKPNFADNKRMVEQQQQADITAMAQARANAQVQAEQAGIPALGIPPAYVQSRAPVQGLVGGMALLGLDASG